MADGRFDPQTGELISREPTLEDLVDLCRTLLERGARFLVVGGFAIRAHGLARNTGAVDLLMDSSLENEARVFDALATLPDDCVRELKPGEVAKYTVVRVADEILVDLMASASGITYAEALDGVIIREIDGAPIPFAGAELLYRMKKRTGLEKDRVDIFSRTTLRRTGTPTTGGLEGVMHFWRALVGIHFQTINHPLTVRICDFLGHAAHFSDPANIAPLSTRNIISQGEIHAWNFALRAFILGSEGAKIPTVVFDGRSTKRVAEKAGMLIL